MRRIIVPLEGNSPAPEILRDANRMAGPDGEIILVRHAGSARLAGRCAPQAASPTILEDTVSDLRERGFMVQGRLLTVGKPPEAIGNAAREFDADMIVAPIRRRSVLLPDVAWKSVSRSPVPILLRHLDNAVRPRNYAEYMPLSQRRILVPLDGSLFAERALPLAEKLATEWRAALWLVHVIHEGRPIMGAPLAGAALQASRQNIEPRHEMYSYLCDIARQLTRRVRVNVLTGHPLQALRESVVDWSITDVVMASNSRAGLSRVILGSLAASLVQQLHLPVVIVPPRASVPDRPCKGGLRLVTGVSSSA